MVGADGVRRLDLEGRGGGARRGGVVRASDLERGFVAAASYTPNRSQNNKNTPPSGDLKKSRVGEVGLGLGERLEIGLFI